MPEKRIDQQKEKLGGLDFPKLHRKIDHQDQIFLSNVHGDCVAEELRNLLEESDKIEALTFAKALFHHSLMHSEDEKPISEATAENLANDELFVEKFIETHPIFFIVGRRKGKGKTLDRVQNESAVEYLMRAYRRYQERTSESLSAIGAGMGRHLEALLGTLSDPGQLALREAASSAARIDGMMRDFTAFDAIQAEKASVESYLGTRYTDIPQINLPPNPAHETNDHLEKLTLSMKEMRVLFVEQASIQRNLNTVATEILDKFVIGSRDAARSSKNALLVAGLAIAATLIPFFFEIVYDQELEMQLASQRRIEAVLVELKNEAKTSDNENEERAQRLIESIERLETAIVRDRRRMN